MSESEPSGIASKKPQSVFKKAITFQPLPLFKALAKAAGHTAVGKWEELGADAADALGALGVSTEPGELASTLVRRAITRAIFDLAGDSASQHLTEAKVDADDVVQKLSSVLEDFEFVLDRRFLDRPADIGLLATTQLQFSEWLKACGIDDAAASAISNRLPSYFVHALNNEWRKNSKTYQPILRSLETPFTKAGQREWEWAEYIALLQRRVDEGVFNEPFSLRQLYIPLNAYYMRDTNNRREVDERVRDNGASRRVVVSVSKELDEWLESSDPQDAIRVVSGGPGSGKSSFARIFAASVAARRKVRLLFLSLHLIDPSKDLVSEVGRYVHDEGILSYNPLDASTGEPRLLLILDGLDELASQGRAGSESARDFVREVERTVEKRNLSKIRLRVLFTGRELVVQENQPEFRRTRQILTLLPYFVSSEAIDDIHGHGLAGHDLYDDRADLLRHDLRQDWWRTYGALTGKAYAGLPPELSRRDLGEVTAQPLLNYLVALSHARGKLSFASDVNINQIYYDLIAAIHERGYEKRRPYAPIRHMSFDQFVRILEEIGLAAWHGDGRTTTVAEIEEHCRASGVGALLDVFQEGARAGVTRLLAAFFFRQHGQRKAGEPTFIFTHKSFGEYLAARRVARSMERTVKEIQRRDQNPDEGWDNRDALRHWTQICGPSALTRYLQVHLLHELHQRPRNSISQWQHCLTGIFSYMLRHGMPMEQCQQSNFKDALTQSRNAEEALLVGLNGCARISGDVSEIEHSDPRSFGAWLRRIQGQRVGPESALALDCLSYLNLRNVYLDIADLYGANLQGSDLRHSFMRLACLQKTRFDGCNLAGADLWKANVSGTTFRSANLSNSRLDVLDMENAKFDGATFHKTTMTRNIARTIKLTDAQVRGIKWRPAKPQVKRTIRKQA